jgi:hypothetical protein
MSKRLFGRHEALKDLDTSQTAVIAPSPPHYAAHSHHVIGLFVRALGVFVCLSLGNGLLQIYKGISLGYGNSLNSLLFLLVSLSAFVMGRQGMIRQATITLITGVLVCTMITVIGIGMGPRAPVMLLPIVAIGLAHFQFGARTGRMVCLLSASLVLIAYSLEAFGFIPGAHGNRFSPTINSLVMLSGVYLLTFLTAAEMQGRADSTLQILEQQNQALTSTIERAWHANRSHDLFLRQITPDLLADCEHLTVLCDHIAKLPSNEESVESLLRQADYLNTATLRRFEALVATVEAQEPAIN